MKVINKFNLPEPLVKAVSWQLKPRRGFSVTDLINPPRVTQLTRRHFNEIEVDASEMIWALLGSSVHSILERGELPSCFREQTLKAKVDGTEITGRPDLWHEGVLDDYKITSSWSIVYEPKGRTDWHTQLNMYQWLYKINGLESTKLRVCAILRDWERSKAGDGKYPKVPVAIIEIPIWPDNKIESFILDRVKLHKAAKTLTDSELPLCNDEEMWAKRTQYALMNKGGKQAAAIFYSPEEAQNRLDGIVEGRGYYIQERPGKRVRCEGYCDVAPWCNQFQEYKLGRA